MSQTFPLPRTIGNSFTQNLQALEDAALALRSGFSGATAPATAEAGMVYWDTATKAWYQRNAANSAWVRIAPANEDCSAFEWGQDIGTLNATKVLWVPPKKSAIQVLDLVIVSDTASTSSSGNEWQFKVTNKTATLELFSGTVGTFTALSGVGGGAEIATNTAYLLTANQNNTNIAANSALEITLTKVGAATSLTRVGVYLRGIMVGA